MIKKKRDEVKQHEDWKKQRMQEIQSLNRDRQKLGKKLQSVQNEKALKDAQLEKRERIIKETKAKLKSTEKQLMNAARGLVRKSQGGAKEQRSKEQKLINMEVDAHMSSARVRKQMQRLDSERIELKQQIQRAKMKLLRYDSAIPEGCAPPTPGLKEEHQASLENLQTELGYKEEKIREIQAQLESKAAPGGFEDLDQCSVSEAKEVCCRVFTNLIEEKEERQKLSSQLVSLQAEFEQRAKENSTLKKRLAMQKAADQECIEQGHQWTTQSAAVLEEERKQLQQVTDENKSMRQTLAQRNEELDNEKGQVNQLHLKVDEMQGQLNKAKVENKGLQSRLQAYPSAADASSNEDAADKAEGKGTADKLEAAEERAKQSQANADAAEEKYAELLMKFKRQEKKMAFYDARSAKRAATAPVASPASDVA